MKLPRPSFFWGAATSSHQVEGNNHLNDWWEWEVSGKLKYPSGLACDHYQRFREDFKLAKELGHNAHRFSVEWSRIEPRENEWNDEALNHYVEVLKELRSLGIEPFVTLHHFTMPTWLADKDGWLNPKIDYYFERFTQKVIERLGPYVTFWVTINEPLVYVYQSYLGGVWPPGLKSLSQSFRVVRNMLHAHVRSYQAIHRYYKDVLHSQPYVSIAKHVSCFEPCRKKSIIDQFTAWLRDWIFNDMFIAALVNGFVFFPGILCEFLPAKQSLDYLGINYYMRDFIRWDWKTFAGMACSKEHHDTEIKELNAMGWDIYPEGLYILLKRLSRYNLPIVITENGICSHGDEQRVAFIQNHLERVIRARNEGVKIEGYFYWSLMDNFEWAYGYEPRFGIVEVDFKTQERKVRKSAYVLRDICRNIADGGV